MGFVTSIAGVIFGGRYHLKLQASATGWSWYSFWQSKLRRKFKAEFCSCWFCFPYSQQLVFSWRRALGYQSLQFASLSLW
jgi:hypothetical protein